MTEKKEARKDGSKKFKLVGGPLGGILARLYPSNDGWELLPMRNGQYVAPPEQPSRGKPVLNWEETNAS